MTNDDLATRLRRLRAGQPMSAEWVGRTLAALRVAAGAGDTMASAAETLYLPAGAARDAAFVSARAGGTDGTDWRGWVDTLPVATGRAAAFDHGVAAFRVGDAGLAIIPPFPLPAVAAGRRLGIDDAPMRTLLATEFTVGVALVRLGRYAIAVYEGRRLLASKTDTRYVKSKHHAGGTSQQRFRRVREGQIHRLYTAAGGILRQQWQPYLRRLDYVALGGEGATVNGFVKECATLARLAPITLPRRLDVREPNRAALEEQVGKLLYQCRVYPWRQGSPSAG